MKITGIFATLVTLALCLVAPAADAAQDATQVTSYETPCYHRERVARGIPAYSVHEGVGLMGYIHAHLHGNTPDEALAGYWAALDACDRNHPVSRWDWGSMVVARVEYLG